MANGERIDSASDRLLRTLMRLAGSIMSLAWAAVVMPRSWMVWTNDWLGLPPLAEGPLVEYLARSLSALYAIQGGLFLLASRDLTRYRPVVVFMAAAHLIFGVIVCWVDLKVGMPNLWTIGEGPPVILFNALLLYLATRPAGADSR